MEFESWVKKHELTSDKYIDDYVTFECDILSNNSENNSYYDNDYITYEENSLDNNSIESFMDNNDHSDNSFYDLYR